MDVQATDVLSAVGGVASAATAIREGVTALRAKLKGNKDAEKELSSVLEVVLSLQTRVIDLQQAVLGIQQQLIKAEDNNAQLREKIRQEEERSANRKRYVNKKVGKSTVMVAADDPDTYYCPTCWAQKQLAIPIQPHELPTGTFGTHECTVCDTPFRLK